MVAIQATQGSQLFGGRSFFSFRTFLFACEDGLGSEDAIAECSAIGIELTPDRIALAGVCSHSICVERLDMAFELLNCKCKLSLKCVSVKSHVVIPLSVWWPENSPMSGDNAEQ